MDLPFVLSNLASLTGVPVRMREDGVVSDKRYSVVSLPLDPFLFHAGQIPSSSSHVSFFFTKESFYYGRVKKGNQCIVIGPVSQISFSESKLREIVFKVGVPSGRISSFVSALNSIPSFPLAARTRCLLRINYIWNDERLNVSSVLITDEKEERLEASSLSIEEEAKPDDGSYPHNTYRLERKRLDYVKEGDIDALGLLFSSERPSRTGIIAQTPIRQRKNRRIVSATLVSRACIEGGRGIEEALSLSDRYLQKRERSNSQQEIQNLSYHRIMDYASKRQSISGKNAYSRTIKKAIAYIQCNVNKKITIQEVADQVYLSKNRFEIRFKEETGMTVHDFIRQAKRNEAKKLLSNTKRSLQEISGYLCFSSQSYFQNVFRKRFDRTPYQYREMNKK